MSQHREEPHEFTAETQSSALPLSRREFFEGAGAAGVALATSPLARSNETATPADGTPEQIHLTWGADPSRTVVLSWASPAQAVNPRVIVQPPGAKPRVIHAVQRTYTDGLNGQTVFTYHATLDALTAHSSYRYSVTADNDSRHKSPFAATFQTAPRGRT